MLEQQHDGGVKLSSVCDDPTHLPNYKFTIKSLALVQPVLSGKIVTDRMFVVFLPQKYCSVSKAFWFESCHWRGIYSTAVVCETMILNAGDGGIFCVNHVVT